MLRASGTPRPRRIRGVALVALVVAGLAVGAARKPSTAPAPPSAPSATATGANPVSTLGWIEVDYGRLVDRRRLTHSGESIGSLLDKLGGRPLPASTALSEDLLAYKLLDPLLEPYAFVMADALDALAAPPDPPLVEIGDLYRPGEAQPAWAELLRSRRLLVESDGAGKMRALLPWSPPAGAPGPSVDSGAAATEAWDEAWPVLRHVAAAERRRLARASGDRPENHTLEVEVHPYVHLLARSVFELGVKPYRVRVDDTRPRGDRPALDVEGLRALLGKGVVLEGGKLEADGRIRWLFSDAKAPPRILGRPIDLSDFAVAYRAVFHGGLAEPYMSLDRGISPQVFAVNYGGRLQDTSLGLVSLLCDVRFKTFSVGVDIFRHDDVREEIRRSVPGFRTHLERFASDPTSQDVSTQQTRFWFYPDDVDLTLSEEGDVLVLRRARMTAASERVAQGAGKESERPWTAATVSELNGDHEELAALFPELGDLDQTVRLLSVFTWLEQARREGRKLPDLDVLLTTELPPVPTPRRFPQLLSYDVLPPRGAAGSLDVFDRVPIAEALERLLPPNGKPLSARRRLGRALAALDRRAPEQAALAKEIEGIDWTGKDDAAIDLLAFRAERVAMHQVVLATLSAADRAKVDRRKSGGEPVRVFSVGIGGIDLGMSQALARARGRKGKSFGVAAPAAPTASPASTGVAPAGSVASTPRPANPGAEIPARAPAPASEARGEDPPGLPPAELPDHGLGEAKSHATAEFAGGRGHVAHREFGGHSIQVGTLRLDDKRTSAWVQTGMGLDGPDARVRRRVRSPEGAAPGYERLEDGRLLRFHFEIEPGRMRAAVLGESLPPEAEAAARDPRGVPPPSPAPGTPPASPGLALLELLGPAQAQQESTPGAIAITVDDGRHEPAGLRLHLRAGNGKDLEATFPRGVLQRLVLGHEADLSAPRPLPALTPPDQLLGGAASLMIAGGPLETMPPWEARDNPAPGEEDPAVVARALARWWSESAPGAEAPGVFVGVDAERSPARWNRAPVPGKRVLLLLPDDAFPGVEAAARKTALAGAWSGDAVVSSLPATIDAEWVVLVSAEAPDLLGARLRSLARSESFRGKLLAVYALSGPIRSDLPASLLAEGKLAGVGVAEASAVGRIAAAEALASLRGTIESGPSGRRVEAIRGPFLWFF